VPELFYVYFLSRSPLHTPCIGMYPLPSEDPPPAVSSMACYVFPICLFEWTVLP
jgi:hypothetical protein